MRPAVTASSCRAAVVLAALVLSGAFAQAQQVAPASPPPTRDTSASQESTGTGRLSVSVVAADTGLPVRKVRVVLSGVALAALRTAMTGPAATATLLPATLPGRVQKEAVTDDRGQVEFVGLPSGNFSVIVQAASPYARQERASSAGVNDGQSSSLTIRLERGGAITGRILDEDGEPMARASVQAIGKNVGGVRGLSFGGGPVATDDRGQFRIFDLRAGEYIVSANRYTATSFDASSTWEPTVGYVPTYYPGTATIESARPVTVRAGQDTSGVDFGLLQGRLGRVVGTALDSTGAPFSSRSGSVGLSTRTPDHFGSSLFAQTAPDGTFTIPNVPPGDYLLIAQMQRGQGPTADREAAFVPVTVNGEEVAASIRTNKGAVLSGRVIVEGSGKSVGITGAAAPPPVGGTASVVRVSTRPPTATVSFPTYSPGTPDASAPEGTFRLTGVRGPVLLGVYSQVGVVKSIRRGTEDLMHGPLELTGTERIDDIEVVVTTDTGALTGMVTDNRGQPAPGLMVIVFTDNPRDWFYASPFVHPARTMTVEGAASVAARTAAAAQPGGGVGAAQPGAAPAAAVTVQVPRRPGQFVVPRLLPGRYYVATLPDDDGKGAIVLPDQETISSLRQRATLVEVLAGEVTAVTVRTDK